MKHNYCTVYSKSYLYMGLILYNSLLKHDRDFCLYFICMDNKAFSIMQSLNLDHINLINLKDIEMEDKELHASKSNRTEKEYSWTIKGSVLLYLFKHFEMIEHIIWLDGDIKFLSDPQPIFDKLRDCSILLTEEKYTGSYEYLSKIYGLYQLGFIGFSRDENSLKCLEWYRSKLIEWCHEIPIEGKWSDQMYAVDWPDRFEGVEVSDNAGINLTPFIAYRLWQEGKGAIHEQDGHIFVDSTKIIFFHFYAFKFYDGNEFDLCLHWMKFSDAAIKLLYYDYISDAKEAVEKIRSVSSDYYLDSNKKGKYIRNYFNLQIAHMKDMCFFCTLVDKRKIVRLLAMYESLNRYMPQFVLWVCCMDEKSYSILSEMNIPNLILLDSKNIEVDDLNNVMLSWGKDRYINLIKSGLSYFILKNNHSVEKLLYLDPDIYFFSDPSMLFEAWQEGCIFVHRFPVTSEVKKPFEIFHSGLVGLLRKEGTLYFLEDCVRACKNNSYYDMPLADYYGIRQVEDMAANADIYMLRLLLPELKKDLICVNFRDLKSLRIIMQLLERNLSTLSKNQELKRICETYIKSLREAYLKLKSLGKDH